MKKAIALESSSDIDFLAKATTTFPRMSHWRRFSMF
jgi:hypothetical protein